MSPLTCESLALDWKPKDTKRWLYRLSEPVRFDYRDGVPYAEGEEVTWFVVVSQGRLRDTVIFPADRRGGILDTTGFKSWGSIEDPDACMAVWLAESPAVAS